MSKEKKMQIGDIVDVNGQPRLITRIEGDRFFSSPVSDDVKEAAVEVTHVEKVVTKRKKG